MKQLKELKMQLKNLIKKICDTILLLCLVFLLFPVSLKSQTVNELESKIKNFEEKIAQLEKEIAQEREKVMDTSKKAADLQSVVNSLNQTRKALEKEIQRTENIIDKSETNIKKLSIEIDEKGEKIVITNKALAEAVRSLNILEERSIFEVFFSNRTLSDFANDLSNIQKVKETLRTTKNDLIVLHKDLNEKKGEEEDEKKNLEQEQKELVGQKQSIEYTKKEKDSLLAATKNQEAKYKEVLAQKEAQRKAFESELLDIESKLKILIDPNSFPGAQRGVLAWPVSGFRITQLYGITEFSKKNPQFYKTGEHNGVDLAVPIGTPVKAAQSGVVIGFDNTDKYPGCYSWGGWVAIKHDNGLATLYAHLSSSIVSVGQRVEQGQVIAYSGSTGISTGPHLHFTLYAAQGVTVRYYKDIKPSATGCGATNAQIPIASLDSYLDPMLYLPQL
jgi:murein DD-endopeptidase MepM/ murein hydrolase activator NlpD